MKKIKDIEKTVGLSRSMIYKLRDDRVFDALKMKLKTNDRGRLIFDDNDINNLWVIKFYKDMGYTHKKLKDVFSNPEYDRTTALKEQIAYLEEKVGYYQKLLKVAKDIVEIGVTPETLRRGLPKNITFNEMLDLVNSMAISSSEPEDLTDSNFDEEKIKNILNIIDKINSCRIKGIAFDSDEVQEYVSDIHNELSEYLSDSNYAFNSFAIGFAPDTETARDIDAYFESGTSEFVYQACDYYFQNRDGTLSFDAVLAEGLQNIMILASQNFAPESTETQSEIKKIYEYFNAMKFVPESNRRQVLFTTISQLISMNPELNRLGKQVIEIVNLYFKMAIEKFLSEIDNGG